MHPDTTPAEIKVGGSTPPTGSAASRHAATAAAAHYKSRLDDIGENGDQSTDFILLFMNKDGINSLLKSKFTLGGDASVAAGPVGRQAGAETDAKFNSQILSYSRSKGLFAGLELKGVSISIDEGDMRDVYGEGISAKAVLQENKVNAPGPVRAFPDALARYTARAARQ